MCYPKTENFFGFCLHINIYDIGFVEDGYYYVGQPPQKDIPDAYVFKIGRQ